MGIYASMGIVGMVAVDFVKNLINVADGVGGIAVYAISGFMIYLLVKEFLKLFAKKGK